MELEHLFQQSGAFTAFQVLFMSSLLIPGMIGRTDLYRNFVGSAASFLVSFLPMGMLLYVLYQVTLLG